MSNTSSQYRNYDIFNVSGDDIYLGNRHVGSLLPDLWATLRDTVEQMLSLAEEDTVPADEMEEALKALEAEHAAIIKELTMQHEQERDKLEEQLDQSELAASQLRDLIADIQGEHGLKGVIEELRAEIAREQAAREQAEAKLRERIAPVRKSRKSI